MARGGAAATPGGGAGDRIVIVEPAGEGWRVHSAHMEPLCFAAAEEADRTGRRVAQNLARLGLDTRLDTYRAGGEIARSERFPAETVRLRFGRRRRLHS